MRQGPPELPEGYHLDLSSDPDAPVLRRPDGTAAACFSAWGTTDEAVEQEALEDLLHGSEEPLGRGPNGPGAREGSGLSRGNEADGAGSPARAPRGSDPG